MLPVRSLKYRSGDDPIKCINERFNSQFGISPQLQTEAFHVEHDWFKEERMISPSVPGITTNYLSHEVKITVKTATLKGLDVIGLPNMSNFSTKKPGSNEERHWKWSTVGGLFIHGDVCAHWIPT